MESTEAMALTAEPAADNGEQARLLAVNVQQAAGTSAQAIQSAVEAYRQDLGDNRQEINWDGVPNTFAAPNAFPADFFNINSPRGDVSSYQYPYSTGFKER